MSERPLRLLSIILLVVPALAGCTLEAHPTSLTPTPSALPLTPASTYAPTVAPLPTSTSLPTQTTAPSSTPASTPTQTLALASADCVSEFGKYEGYSLLVF